MHCSRPIFAVALAIAAFVVFAEDVQLSAQELVVRCREMTPQRIEASGRIVLRNRRGIPQAEYAYVLSRDGGSTEVKVFDKDGGKVSFAKSGNLLGTDVNWSDLTLEYLWWNDVKLEAEDESVHGQVCAVVRLTEDGREVKIWIDRKTGALMQAEEISGGRPLRRLWGTRIKKFGERWAPNVLEVETIGSGHRTKITVEEIK